MPVTSSPPEPPLGSAPVPVSPTEGTPLASVVSQPDSRAATRVTTTANAARMPIGAGATAEDPEELALADPEADAVDRPQLAVPHGEVGDRDRRHQAGSPATSGHGRAASSCAERENKVASSSVRPTSCTATGRPSAARPQGTDAAGLPATFQSAA